MKAHVLRLKKGDDLKDSIITFCESRKIESGYIANGIGSLDEIRIRKADGKSEFFEVNQFEILSLQGTLSKNGIHAHISASDVYLDTIGGHLLKGCKINTTAEIVIIEFKNIELSREYDEETGYKELIINEE